MNLRFLDSLVQSILKAQTLLTITFSNIKAPKKFYQFLVLISVSYFYIKKYYKKKELTAIFITAIGKIKYLT